MKIEIESKITEQHGIRCPYCNQKILGNGKAGAEHNYQVHLDYNHKEQGK